MELLSAMRGRRSVRKFSPRVIERNLIEEILQEAAWAPSGGNLQPWKVAVLDRDAVRRYLAEHENAAVNLLAVMMKIDVLELATRSGQPPPPNVDEHVLVRMKPMVCMEDAPPSHLVVIYFERSTLAGFVGNVRKAAGLVRYALSRCAGVKAKLSYLWLMASRFLRLRRMDAAVKVMGLSNYTYALTLAAFGRGIDSCIQCHFAADPAGLRRLLGLGSRHDVIACVALGYPHAESDPAQVAKPVSTARTPVPIRWIG